MGDGEIVTVCIDETTVMDFAIVAVIGFLCVSGAVLWVLVGLDKFDTWMGRP